MLFYSLYYFTRETEEKQYSSHEGCDACGRERGYSIGNAREKNDFRRPAERNAQKADVCLKNIHTVLFQVYFPRFYNNGDIITKISQTSTSATHRCCNLYTSHC